MTFKINRNEAKIEMLTTNTTFGQYFELVTTLQRNAMLRVFCLQSEIERERIMWVLCLYLAIANNHFNSITELGD